MALPFGLIMLVGKYLFLALLYWFLIWAFRGLFSQLAREGRAAPVPVRPQPVAAVPATQPAPVAPPRPVSVQPRVVTFERAEPRQPIAAPSRVELPVAPAPAPAPPIAATPARAQAVLVVQEPGQSSLKRGQVIELTAAVTMGRAEDNGLVLGDRFCSSHHAMVFLQAGQRYLRDRNSTNGTFHNGQRVTEDALLLPGDRVAMGTVVFEYRVTPA